jgi:cytochrome P450
VSEVTTRPPRDRCGNGPDDGGQIRLEELTANPYPTYKKLREQGVVWVEAVDRWLVTRWEDLDEIERDSDRFTARERDSLQTRVMGRTMLRTDGDEHRRLRTAVQVALTPKVIEEHWLPVYQGIAKELVDQFVDDGHADLITQFANPMAARSLGAILGLTDSSVEDLLFWSQALMDATANYGDDPAVWVRCERAIAGIDQATTEAMARVEAEPDHSMISAMVNAPKRGAEPLSEDEVRANVKLSIGGGLNEPRDGIGLTVWGLLHHPEQMALVLEDPDEWLPRATEESLRWVSPLAMFPREVAKPVRLADTDLEPGARLGLLVASANRDERHWDRPDEFDIARPKARNVAFGVGHHFCLGVWMSRYQIGRAALPELFARIPGLRLDLDRTAEIRGWVFRGHTSLPVVW